MIRLISIATAAVAIAACAGAVSAEDIYATPDPSIRVTVAGKDAPTIVADIRSAASKVCGDALRGDALGPEMMSRCETAAVDAAMAQVPKGLLAVAPKPERIASQGVER